MAVLLVCRPYEFIKCNIKKSALLRKGENEINRWADRHSVERATVQAIQWLTRAPDRFSAAQFSPLLEHENHQRRLLTAGMERAVGWINRLKSRWVRHINLAVRQIRVKLSRRAQWPPK